VANLKPHENSNFLRFNYATYLPIPQSSHDDEERLAMDFLIAVIGVVMIVEGIPWFLSPGGYKRLLLQMLPLGDTPLRLLGLSFMGCGLLLVYLAKS
jgi:uncharacterized protein YjeT (DUF2065 family)